MIDIFINDKSRAPLPENWAELVAQQKYIPVVSALFSSNDVYEAKWKIFEALTGINGYEWGKLAKCADAEARKKLADNFPLSTAMAMKDKVFPVFDFIFKPELLTTNPIPSFKFEGTTFYGPGEKLANQSGAEMEETTWAYAEYVKTGEIVFLDNLVAAMYRPRPLFSKKPIAYSKEFTAALTKQFAKLPIDLKYGILFFYQMVEQWWYKEYEHLYDTVEKTEAAEGEEEEKQIDSLAMLRIIGTLAGAKLGTINQVRALSRDEIYFRLAELERQRENSKK